MFAKQTRHFREAKFAVLGVLLAKQKVNYQKGILKCLTSNTLKKIPMR